MIFTQYKNNIFILYILFFIYYMKNSINIVIFVSISIQNNSFMQTIQVLSMLEREVKRKKYSHADLSRMLHISSNSIMNLFRRNTMQIQRLAELSEALQYNFFREIADTLPYAEPVPTKKENDCTIEQLQARIKELEMEISVMRRTFKDLSGHVAD